MIANSTENAIINEEKYLILCIILSSNIFEVIYYDNHSAQLQNVLVQNYHTVNISEENM